MGYMKWSVFEVRGINVPSQLAVSSSASGYEQALHSAALHLSLRTESWAQSATARLGSERDGLQAGSRPA